MDATAFVSYTAGTTATAPTASAPTSMVCHPAWPKYDMRNYPTWPADVILGFTCSILGIFILCLRITAFCTKRRLLKRLKAGTEGDLAERVRVEMVKVAMEIRREGDPPPRAWGAGGKRERRAGWKDALCLYGVLRANFLLYMRSLPFEIVARGRCDTEASRVTWKLKNAFCCNVCLFVPHPHCLHTTSKFKDRSKMRFSIPSPQNPVLSWSQVLMFMLNIISFVLTQHYGASEHHLKTGGYVVSAISVGY